VLVTVNQSKRGLYSRDLSAVSPHKMVDAIQDESETTFQFNEEVHNCPVVWDVLSVVYKDAQNKEKQMEELVDKLHFVQTFLFLHHLFSSVKENWPKFVMLVD